MAVFLMGKMVINQWMEQGTLSQNGCRLKNIQDLDWCIGLSSTLKLVLWFLSSL